MPKRRCGHHHREGLRPRRRYVASWASCQVGRLWRPHRAYADLDPASPDVDMATALTDMISYNGGKPLSCSA